MINFGSFFIFRIKNPTTFALAGLEFKREERLKSKKMLQALFNGGNSFVSYPLRVVWAYIPAEEMPASPYPAQLAVAVSKRHVKTAVARNSIKRRIREAYRLHKPEFYQKLQQFNGPIGIMLMYVGKELLPFEDIEAGVLKMIRKFPGDRPRQHPTNGNPDRTP